MVRAGGEVIVTLEIVISMLVFNLATNFRCCMKIYCDCGQMLSDSTDYLSYKAHLIPDQDIFDLYEGIDANLAELVEDVQRISAPDRVEIAIKRTSRLICLLISKYSRRFLYQCTNCGMLFLDNSSLHAFAPCQSDVPRNLLRSVEGDKWKGPLRGDWDDGRSGEGKGWLWWWKSEGEEGVQQFHDWESLQLQYHEVLGRLQSKNILRDAALRRNSEVVHFWPP